MRSVFFLLGLHCYAILLNFNFTLYLTLCHLHIVWIFSLNFPVKIKTFLTHINILYDRQQSHLHLLYSTHWGPIFDFIHLRSVKACVDTHYSCTNITQSQTHSYSVMTRHCFSYQSITLWNTQQLKGTRIFQWLTYCTDASRFVHARYVRPIKNFFIIAHKGL